MFAWKNFVVSSSGHRKQVTRIFSTSANKENMMKTAGIIIIGDEILKGQTQDTNSFYLATTLHRLGVSVKKISVIGDDLNTIASEVKQLSSSFDFVLTSGGIGPTHDDVTFEGVARAFDETIAPHPTLVSLCQKYFGRLTENSPEMKLACLPQSAVLHFGTDTLNGEKFKFPLVSTRNVFIFPGIPVLLRRLIDNLHHLFASDASFHAAVLRVNALETEIAETLSSCTNRFKDSDVTIGSYPDWFNNYYKVKVIVESPNEESTQHAVSYLQSNLTEGKLVADYIENPVSLRGRDVFGGIIKEKFPLLHQKVLHSVQILEEAFQRYPKNAICIGFNGGKDCTALLHIYYAVMCRLYPDSQDKLGALYIKDLHPFEELEAFMEDSVDRYNLDINTLNGAMKAALRHLHQERPEIKAVVMGTRCGDPYSSGLTSFTACDKDWPPFMRVNPLLNWTYHDIWTFLRALNLPYCVLYDRGYTSLGSRDKTSRNSKLAYKGNGGNVRYAPAYTLQNEDMERNGRL
ncbi:FAD synthase-like isoform X1 [Clavelina lepadiformis]|uniref:FAD synthase-like isoform X1 n=2 Tax=Clavelina lepadiformis TaxID=159417 RepID=UPI0040421DA3